MASVFLLSIYYLSLTINKVSEHILPLELLIEK